MKLFISWSGEKSEAVASALRIWLPCIFQSVEVWFSKTDINPGDRWLTELSTVLDKVDFGIMCITEENISSPWILFEAGALSKSVKKGKIIPYLIDCQPSQLSGPLAQFQALYADEEGTRLLVKAIAENSSQNFRDSTTLEAVFKKWWTDLDEKIKQINENFKQNGVRVRDLRVFTTREVSILELLSNGLKDQEIADHLNVELFIVKNHIKSILQKLGAENRKQAVLVAKKLDLIEDNSES